MKIYIAIILVFIQASALAIQDMQLDVVDQNFNSSNKVIITAEQIKKSHASNLAQLLSSQANISVASTSFQPNSIYLRGGDSSHVLILIDGVPTYDPSTVQRTVNLASLNLKNIKKIEIIKGSQSVIYGGQALSGVISIETFPTQLDKSESDVSVAGGPNLGDISLSNLTPWTDLFYTSAAVHASQTQSRSPVLDSNKKYPEQIGSADATALLKLGSDFSTILHINYSNDASQIATTDFATFKAADTENFSASNETYGGTYLLKKKDLFQFSVSGQSTRRMFLQNANDGAGTATDQDYRGQLAALRLDVQALKTDLHQVQWGYNFSQEQMKALDTLVVQSESTNQSEGLYFKADSYLTPLFLIEMGVRNQMSKLQAINNTYQFGVTWNKKWKFEHSTGFKTPSLFQLYSSYGNLNLRPEKAVSSSVSYENKYSEQLFISMTLFDSQFENLIVIKGSPQRYENVSATRTVGTEFLGSFSSVETNSDYSLAIGYQEPRDLSQNNWLVRRALRTASLKVNQNFGDSFSIAAQVNHTGNRRDREAGGRYLTIEDYTLLNLIANFKWTDEATVFARIDNVTALTYQTAYGFYTQGTDYKAGMNFSF